MHSDTSELLTSHEAAKILRIRPQTLAVWRTTKRYALTSIKVGRRVFYRRQELDSFLDRHTDGGAK